MFRRRLTLPTFLLTLIAIAAPSAAAQQPDSPLSTRLAELADRDLRSASPAEQGDAVSLLARGPGSLMRDGGALVVEVRVADHAVRTAEELKRAGAEIIHVSTEYATVSASVQERDLRAVAAVDGVESVLEVITPQTGAAGGAEGGVINTCPTGVISEGNTQLRAGQARTRFDVDGSGIEVGILSDSYDVFAAATKHEADDVASNDLPGPGNSCGRTTPVDVVAEAPDPNVVADEGRAMTQIVHDIAPGAELSFATAFPTQTVFADNIRALAAGGADVIVDDIIYFAEPVYQDGIVANAVRDVTDDGVAYFSMAFNNNGLGKNSYEALAYRSTTCPPVVAALPGADDCMDFNPTAGTDNMFDVNVTSGPLRLGLNWAEPQLGVTTDLNFYVLNTSGTAISFQGQTDNLTAQQAFEFVSGDIGTAGARQIVIQRASGTGTPRLKFISNDNGANRIQSTQAVTAPDIQGPTIYGHNGTAAAETVAAVPYNNSNTAETFSSRGPVTHLFGPVQTATPAPALGAPLVISKPDIAATDGGTNTFFGPGNRFYGTSAAAPHAAGVAALQLEADAALTTAHLLAAQKSTARPVGAFGPLDVGAGLIDAEAAIAAPQTPPVVAITSGPSGPTADTTPTFEFTAAGEVESVVCSVDGGVAQACASPFTTAALAEGPHNITVTATDHFDQETSASRSFTVDTTGPVATIVKGPKRKTSKGKARFRFSASEPGSSFECKLDKKPFEPCTSPEKVKVKKGKHRFQVRATDPLGNVGEPAKRSWKVKKKKR